MYNNEKQGGIPPNYEMNSTYYYDNGDLQQPQPMRGHSENPSEGWDSSYYPEYQNDSYQTYQNDASPSAPPMNYNASAPQMSYDANHNQMYQRSSTGGGFDAFQSSFNSFNEFQNSATAQLGVQLGQNAVQAGSKYVEQNLGRFINLKKLRYYFNVSNGYVLNKLLLLLFPFRHKPWSRKLYSAEGQGQAETYYPPREDINAPDLYIPVTAFVTYILVVGFAAGKGNFKPELLGMTASKALGVVFFEVMLLKLGCYLFSVTSDSQLLDLISYCGYKFVGIIVSILIGRVAAAFGSWIYYTGFIYICMATGFFLLRSLRHIVLPESSMAVGNAFRKRRVNLLFGIAAIQLISCWLLQI